MSLLTKRKNQLFSFIAIAMIFAISGGSIAQNAYTAPKEVLGKVYVEAALDEDGFPVSGREDSAGDLQTRVKDDKEFELVYDEDEADFKMVVTDREAKGNSTRIVRVALYVRDGNGWKPGTKVTYNSTTTWGFAALGCKDDAKKWIKNQNKNR